MHTLPEPDPKISEMLVKAHRKARNVLTALPKVKSGWTIACQAFHAMPGCESEMNQYPREDFFTEAAAGDDFVGVQAYLRTFIGKDGPVPVADEVERTLTGWEYFPPALGIVCDTHGKSPDRRRYSLPKTGLPRRTTLVALTTRLMPWQDYIPQWRRESTFLVTCTGRCWTITSGARSRLHSVLSVGIRTRSSDYRSHLLNG